MAIKDAQAKCPGLVMVSGEDLTPYRAASKQILAVLSRWAVGGAGGGAAVVVGGGGRAGGHMRLPGLHS